MKVRIAEQDYRKAFCRTAFPEAWARLKKEARFHAIERMIAKNSDDLDAAMAKSKSLTGPAWLANSETITRLFAEHDELVEMAFPTTTPEPTP